jgi:hypothetical protein
MCGASIGFEAEQRRVVAVTPEYPRRTSANQFGIYIHRSNKDAADRAPVPIPVTHLDPRIAPERQIRKRLARAIAVGLTTLRRVDVGQANADLLATTNQQSQCITVRDADDPPAQFCRGDGQRVEKHEADERDLEPCCNALGTPKFHSRKHPTGAAEIMCMPRLYGIGKAGPNACGIEPA